MNGGDLTPSNVEKRRELESTVSISPQYNKEEGGNGVYEMMDAECDAITLSLSYIIQIIWSIAASDDNR